MTMVTEMKYSLNSRPNFERENFILKYLPNNFECLKLSPKRLVLPPQKNGKKPFTHHLVNWGRTRLYFSTILNIQIYLGRFEIADFRRRTVGQFDREIESAFVHWLHLQSHWSVTRYMLHLVNLKNMWLICK